MKVFSTGDVNADAAIFNFWYNEDSKNPPYQWMSQNCIPEDLNLLSFKDKVIILKEYNSEMPNELKQPDDLFSEFLENCTDTIYTRSPGTIKIPVIVLSNAEDTIRYYIEVFKKAVPDVLINPVNYLFKVPELDTFEKPGLYARTVSVAHNDLSNLVMIDGCRSSEKVKLNTGWLGLVAYALHGKPLLQLMIDGKLPFLYLADLAMNPKFGYTLRFAHDRIMISIEKKSELNLGDYCISTLSKKW